MHSTYWTYYIVSLARVSFRGGICPLLNLVCPPLELLNSSIEIFLNSKQNHNDELIIITQLIVYYFCSIQFILKIFFKSMSHTFSGDSNAILIRYNREVSPKRFRSEVFIIFICEKLRSTEQYQQESTDKYIISKNIEAGKHCFEHVAGHQFMQLCSHINWKYESCVNLSKPEGPTVAGILTLHNYPLLHYSCTNLYMKNPERNPASYY